VHEADKVSLGAAAATVLRAEGWRLAGLGPEQVRAASHPNGAETRTRETRETRARDEKEKRRERTRETRPTPLGGDEFQDEFAHMKKNKQRQDEFGSIR
jgi:hypothetical protein